MNGFDDLVEKVTQPLRVDPELRMDVANELRAHLEDSAAEFREAGYGADEAAANSIKALGDQDELAQSLWLANRKRMRLRRVAKWTSRVTLVPAALLVTFLLIAKVRTFVLLVSLSANQNAMYGAGRIPLEGLSQQQRYVFEGDPNARNVFEREKSIADRWPDNPVYYANYAFTNLAADEIVEGLKNHDQAVIDEVIQRLDRGERLEPDNALYNFIKAAILIGASSHTEKDPNLTYPYKDRRGKAKQRHCWRIEVTNEDVFEKGLAEFRRGLPKPYSTSHTIDMCRLRLGMLPKAADLNEYLRRMNFTIGVLLPDLSHLRGLGRSLCAYALRLGENGQGEPVGELLLGVEVMGSKMAIRADTIIELLVAYGIRQDALGHGIVAYDALRWEESAAEARAKLDSDNQFFATLFSDDPVLREQIFKHGGILGKMFMPAIPSYQVDTEPFVMAEYIVAERAALTALLAALVLLGFVLSVAVVVSVVSCRNQHDGPKLLFIGWRQLGWICLIALALPLVAYFIYAHVLRLGGAQYSLLLVWPRVVLDSAVVAAVVLMLLFGMSYSAIRQRAQRAGMMVPPMLRWRNIRWMFYTWCLLGFALVVHYPAWKVAISKSDGRLSPALLQWCLVLTGIVGVFVVVWLVRETLRITRFKGELAHFRRTLIRSFLPILAAAVIFLGLAGGVGLKIAEGRALRSAEMFFINEVEKSGFRLLRDRLGKDHNKLLQALFERSGRGKDNASATVDSRTL